MCKVTGSQKTSKFKRLLIKNLYILDAVYLLRVSSLIVNDSIPNEGWLQGSGCPIKVKYFFVVRIQVDLGLGWKGD